MNGEEARRRRFAGGWSQQVELKKRREGREGKRERGRPAVSLPASPTGTACVSRGSLLELGAGMSLGLW